MSDVAVIVSGDDAVLAVTLTKEGATFAISSGATVKAALVSIDRAEVLIPAVTCNPDVSAADWDNSLVAVQFSASATSEVNDYGPALLEVQIDDGGKLTWFVDAHVVKGNIA